MSKDKAKSNAVENLLTVMDKSKDFGIYRIDRAAQTVEFKHVGKGEDREEVLEVKIQIPSRDLFVDENEVGCLSSILNLDLRKDNEKLKAIPMLVMIDNIKRD